MSKKDFIKTFSLVLLIYILSVVLYATYTGKFQYYLKVYFPTIFDEVNQRPNYISTPKDIPKYKINKPPVRRVIRKNYHDNKKYTKRKTIYSWVDEFGIKHFSDTMPNQTKYNVSSMIGAPEYITPNKDMPSGRYYTTNVLINGNQVYVPVTLSYKGIVKSTWLLLDTGASSTTLHHNFAEQIGIIPNWLSYSRVADGRRVKATRVKLDFIQIGPLKVYAHYISVLPYSGPSKIYKGLLGMNFLRKFDYSINFRKKTIRWKY